MSIESVMPSNHLILCSPLLLLPSMFPCIRVFSNESVLHIRLPTEKRDERCSGHGNSTDQASKCETFDLIEGLSPPEYQEIREQGSQRQEGELGDSRADAHSQAKGLTFYREKGVEETQ